MSGTDAPNGSPVFMPSGEELLLECRAMMRMLADCSITHKLDHAEIQCSFLALESLYILRDKLEARFK